MFIEYIFIHKTSHFVLIWSLENEFIGAWWRILFELCILCIIICILFNITPIGVNLKKGEKVHLGCVPKYTVGDDKIILAKKRILTFFRFKIRSNM